MDSNTIGRIKKYRAGAMSAREARQFEADLDQSAELKKAFFFHSVEAYEPPSARAGETRKLVEQAFEALGEVSAPALPWGLRLRLWLTSPVGKWLGVALLAVAALMGYLIAYSPQPLSLSTSALVKRYGQKAECVEDRAGVDVPTAKDMLQKAAQIYCLGKVPEGAMVPELQKLCASGDTGVCIAVKYYLAHWYLEHQEYAKAEVDFEYCTANIGVLEGLHLDLAKCRNPVYFNLLLAKMGTGKPILPALEAFMEQLPPDSGLRREAANLRSELQSTRR